MASWIPFGISEEPFPKIRPGKQDKLAKLIKNLPPESAPEYQEHRDEIDRIKALSAPILTAGLVISRQRNQINFRYRNV
jgi:hypothetical protein